MRFLIIAVIFLSTIDAWAQYEAINFMFWNNYSIVNPAYTGVDNRYKICYQYAKHTSYENLPGDQWALADVGLKTESVGVGLGINYSKSKRYEWESGITRANLNLQFDLNKERILSFGVSAGIYKAGFHFADDNGWLYPVREADEEGDVVIQQEELTFGAGLLYNSKKLTLGLSLQNLNNPSFDFDRHYTNQMVSISTYALMSYRFAVKDNLEISPQLYFFLYEDIKDLNFNLKFTYKSMVWVAGSVYLDNRLGSAMAGINVFQRKIQLGLSRTFVQNYYDSYELFLSLVFE